MSGTKKHVGDRWEENNCQEQYVPELAIPTVLNAPFNGGAVQYQCRTVRVYLKVKLKKTLVLIILVLVFTHKIKI